MQGWFRNWHSRLRSHFESDPEPNRAGRLDDYRILQQQVAIFEPAVYHPAMGTSLLVCPAVVRVYVSKADRHGIDPCGSTTDVHGP